MDILRPMFIRSVLSLAAVVMTASCAHEAPPQPAADPHPFLSALAPYCGQAFEGTIVSDDEADADWRSERIVMHIRDCDEDEVRMPLHVGENRSRTWLVTDIRDGDTGDGLLLKHQHLHEDGKPDAITGYGGRAGPADDNRYSFPADEETKILFDAEGIPVSKANVWVLEYNAETSGFAYELNRPNRFFRIEFDLTEPVDLPPPAWGYTGE